MNDEVFALNIIGKFMMTIAELKYHTGKILQTSMKTSDEKRNVLNTEHITLENGNAMFRAKYP